MILLRIYSLLVLVIILLTCNNYIYLEKDNKKYKTVPISRRFLSRLTQANETILRYRAAPSAKGLAECVKKLESLSFEDVALQLEERELKAHPDFRREFEQAFE